MNKKLILPLLFSVALMGCDDASKVVDKAQDAANKAVDSAQQKMSSLNEIDLRALNLENFGESSGFVSEFVASIDEALNADYSKPEALVKVQEHIANSYSCLVEATSESSAEKLLDKLMSAISDKEAESLIEKGVKSAKEMQECIY